VLKVALDIALWNFAYFVINVVQVLRLLYEMRSIEFDKDKEFIYEHVFFR